MSSSAVQGLSVRFDDLPTHLRIDAFSRSLLFDLTPFRTKPLWLMPDGRALCVDTPLLMERLGAHVFWSVINALDTSERRKQFTSTWGLAFENYCLDALAHVFRATKWTYVRNPLDAAMNDEELADAVATREDVAIVLECKGTFIRSGDKYSGMPGRFFRGLTQKFGHVKHGGVYQLTRAISRIWFRRVARSAIGRTDTVTDVFPVLVVQDPILDCGPVARVLSDRFQAAIRRARRGVTHKAPRIWPLTVMTVDDLDFISAAVQVTGHRLDAILKRFHRLHPSRIVSFGNFLAARGKPDFGFSDEVHEVIRRRFRAGTEATLQRFRDAEYGGAAVDPLAVE